MSDPESQADQTRLTAVEEAYREGNNELPPAALDAAILAQAHTKKFAGRGRWTSPRWIMGLATAAALMLTVSVYRNVELETDLLRDTPLQSKPADEPGRIEPNRNLPNELDDNRLREVGGTAAEAKVHAAGQQAPNREPSMSPASGLPSSPTPTPTPTPTPVAPSEPPPAITKAIEAREVEARAIKDQQPISPQHVPAAVDIEIIRDNDADSARAKLRSQLGQKSASIGRILQETEESPQDPVSTDETICNTQFNFPAKSGEHVVRDNWLSYRLNGTVHTWRCLGGTWTEVPPESDQ